MRELDFRQESMHLLTLSANLREIAEIVVPQPVIGYTSARVLAMEFIPGPRSPSSRASSAASSTASA